MSSPAARAFRSALRAVGDAEFSDPTGPTLKLPEWNDARSQEDDSENWIQVADAGDIAYTLSVRVDDSATTFTTKLSARRAPLGANLWELEPSQMQSSTLRAPFMTGSKIHVAVTADCESRGLSREVCRGWYAAPEKLANMGALGHFVVMSPVDRSHLFAHVMNVQDKGPCIVHACIWTKIESD